MTTYEKGKLYQISIIDFKPDPDQPRKVIDPDALAELAASIKKYGILTPLLFRTADQGWLYIVAGERRYLAAKQAGLLILPAICVEGSHAEIALVENLQRQDLTVIEEAEALQRLMDEQHYTKEQLGEVLGKPRTTINDSISLMRLPQDIRDDCRANRKIGKTRLVEISRKTQERAMRSAYERLKEQMRKEEEGVAGKRGPVLSPPAALCRTLDAARDKLEKADNSNWSEADLNMVNDSINTLQEAIDLYLNPPPEEESGDGDGNGNGEGVKPRMKLS